MREMLAPDYTRDSLRKHGGLLLGLGVLMILLRKGALPPGAGGEDISDFLAFVLYGVTAVYLYAAVFTTDATGGARPWQAVHSVFGLLLVPLALFQGIEWIGGDTGSDLNVMWVWGLTAALGFYAGAVKGIRFHLLFASIALIVSWSALWNELLGDEGIAGNFGTYRGLLGILAIVLLAIGLSLWRTGGDSRVTGTGVEAAGDQGLWKGSELLTGAGIAAVIACSLGITSIFQAFGPLGLFEFTVVETATHWDILLLVVALGLIGLGSTIGTRGPVYVGAIGLVLFLVIVGLDLNEGAEADRTNLGQWPIILLVLGGLFVLLSGVREASLGDQPKQTARRLRGR